MAAAVAVERRTWIAAWTGSVMVAIRRLPSPPTHGAGRSVRTCRQPWDAVVEALQAEGVTHVFGLGGGDFYDALSGVPAIRPVSTRIKAAGVFMAMAAARLTNRPGVCFAESGSGVATLVPGLLEAHAACRPLIVLATAAWTSNAPAGAVQEGDWFRMVEPVTKERFQITRPDRTPWTMRRAFALAVNGRPGPVYVEMPVDIGGCRASIPPYRPTPHPLRSVPAPADVERAAHLVARAERPVLVVGSGAVSSQAFAEVRTLAEHLAIPVLTTRGGRGILPEDHPLALGQVGPCWTEPGKAAYRGADLVIGLGSQDEDVHSDRQTAFPKGAKYVQVDVDPDAIGRDWIPDAALAGDVSLALRAMLAVLPMKPVAQARRTARAQALQDGVASARARVAEECRVNDVPLRSTRIVHELSDVFGRNTVLVQENGSPDLWTDSWLYYRVLDTNGCIPPGWQAGNGTGVAGAIGAKLAMPDRQVVCVTGDGAFQMFAKELPTAVEYKAPVLWVVLNTQAHGGLRSSQERRGGRTIATECATQPDFGRLAELCRCRGERVDKPAEIRPALERARRSLVEGIPVVLHCIVDGGK